MVPPDLNPRPGWVLPMEAAAMSVDKVLSTPLKLDPADYTGGGRGRLEDVLHPQARYLSIQRVERRVLNGPHRGLVVQALLVEGQRPRMLNLGVKRFFVAVTVDRTFEDPSEEEEARKIEAFESYLTRGF